MHRGTNIYVAKLDEKEPGKVSVGFFPKDCKEIPRLVTFAIGIIEQAKQKGMRGVKKVEFIPLSDVPGVPDYDKWRETQTELSEDEQLNCYDYMKYLHTLPVTEQMDAAWSEMKLGDSVYTGALPITINGRSAHVPKARFMEKIVPTEDVVGDLSHLFEARFGDKNVFVSHQLVPIPTLLHEWSAFSDQAYSWLVKNERYWVHKYDEQEHPAGQLYLPAYAIPVSIRKKWAREVSFEEHQEFLLSLVTPVDTNQVVNRILGRMETGCRVYRSYVCPPPVLQMCLNQERDFAYDIAEREGYRLPGQPSAEAKETLGHKILRRAKRILFSNKEVHEE